MKIRVGLEGFSFDSAHYTLSSTGNEQLHGHTYRLSIELEGEIDPNTGFVIDFGMARKIIQQIVNEWDHKLILPKEDADKILLKGPFRVEVKEISYKYPTAEYIGLEIAREIYKSFNEKYKVYLKIFEGEGNYVVIEYP